MSDKAKVFVKYDVTVANQGENQDCRGVISNCYKSFDPIGMVTRNTMALIKLLEHGNGLASVKYDNDEYHYFRRLFDVDFYCRELSVSMDNVEYAMKHYSEDGSENYFSHLIQFVDADFGEFYVDISGKWPSKLKIRYCYYFYNGSEHEIADIERYAEKYCQDADGKMIEPVMEAIKDFKDFVAEYQVQVMNRNELEAVWNTNYEELCSNS